MRDIKIIMLYVFIFLLVPYSKIQAQNVSDYLILSDIGSYKFITQKKDFITGQVKTIPGYTVRVAPGILAGTDHFDLDHNDTTYETDYVNFNIELAVEVQVTQHSGSDSDKWLLHEVERDFRTYYGLPDDSFVARQIDNNTIIGLSVAGWTYRWVSGNKVIQIQYHDSQMTKPEPLEIVKVYLAKHPSTLQPTTSADLRNKDNETNWIKDEMDRRLWLCDKWFLQIGKLEQNKVLQEEYNHMKVFLEYREKYYGVKALDEKNTLWGYLKSKDETSIRSKLTEYKNWWSANKGKGIKI